MAEAPAPGQIIILNGTPRSGKSSIAAAVQNTFDGVWMNLGVDRFMQMTPSKCLPGIGLRPGGERPDLEPLILTLYRAMYESIAAHSRLGLNVVVDVGHHDAYAVPRGILPDCARRLSGLPVLFVGVRCPLEIIMERRRATWGAGDAADAPVPASRALVARGCPHPGHLRPGGRHLGAEPGSMCRGDPPAPGAWPAAIGLPATRGHGGDRRLNRRGAYIGRRRIYLGYMQPLPNSYVQPTRCATSDAGEQTPLSPFTQSLTFPEWSASYIGLILNSYTMCVHIE